MRKASGGFVCHIVLYSEDGTRYFQDRGATYDTAPISLPISRVCIYRRWGAAIANANANLRLTRLENLYTSGPTVRAWGARADAGVVTWAAPLADDLGDLARRPDTGGSHGPGFL